MSTDADASTSGERHEGKGVALGDSVGGEIVRIKLVGVRPEVRMTMNGSDQHTVYELKMI